MARTYKRDSRGRFAGGGGGSSRGGGRKPLQRGTNRLTRDNAGRITSVGGDGATARGGRLRTASGRQRATVTTRGIGKAPAGTVGRSGRVKAPARVAAKPALKRTGIKSSIPSLKTNTERGRRGIVSMSTGAKQARRGAVAERKAERRARVVERQSGIVARRQGNRLSTYSPSGAFNQAAQNLNQSKLKKSKQIQSWLTTGNPADKPQSRRQKQAAAKPAATAKPASRRAAIGKISEAKANRIVARIDANRPSRRAASGSVRRTQNAIKTHRKASDFTLAAAARARRSGKTMTVAQSLQRAVSNAAKRRR